MHERAREWADASRFRFRLLLMHEYLFGAAAGNRWVDGTAVARPQADAVRAPGRHSFLDPKTLRYLKARAQESNSLRDVRNYFTVYSTLYPMNDSLFVFTKTYRQYPVLVQKIF